MRYTLLLYYPDMVASGKLTPVSSTIRAGRPLTRPSVASRCSSARAAPLQKSASAEMKRNRTRFAITQPSPNSTTLMPTYSVNSTTTVNSIAQGSARRPPRELRPWSMAIREHYIELRRPICTRSHGPHLPASCEAELTAFAQQSALPQKAVSASRNNQR